MKNLPTDLEILEKIYEDYYQTFISYSKENPDRAAKIYVPIDIEKIAEEFDVDVDIIFGRLHYHLNEKYGYQNDDDSYVHFFARVIGDEKHCIHFPLAGSVLASLKKESKKFWIATSIAAFSLLVSVSSLIISLLV